MRLSHALPALILAAAVSVPARERADWTFHSFPLSNIDVYDLAAREDTLYLFSSFPLGLYRSRDDGATWEILDSTVAGHYYGVEADGGEVFFFGGSGLLRSRNNGASWHRADKGMEGAEIRDLFPMGPILYAATGRGVFRSADRGDSWTRVHQASEPAFFSMTSVGDILFAGCITLNQDSSLFRSADNGLSWKPAETPAKNLGFLGTVTGHGGHLYVTAGSEGLMRCRPDGSGWERVEVGEGADFVSRTWSDGATLYAYTKGGMFRSPDSGATWIPQGPPGGRGEAHLALVQGSRLFEQTQGHGVNESRDNGATWKPLSLPKRMSEMLEDQFPSGPHLFAYRRFGPAYYTRDLGRTWVGPVKNTFQAFAETGGRLFASVGYGSYLHSADHGVTWSPLPLPPGNVRPTAFLAADDGWLYSGSDFVYRRPATPERVAWEACPVLKPAPLPAVPTNYFTRVIADGSLVFAGSWDGRWQYSADSGASWRLVDTVLQATQPRSLAGGTAWVAATARGVFRSPDGESHWAKVDAGWDDSAFSVLRHGTAFFVGGADGRIAYSQDQGSTWKTLASIPGMGKVGSLAVQDGRLAVVSPFQGIWSMPLPEGVSAVIAAPGAPASVARLRLRSGVMKAGDAVDLFLAEPALMRLSLHAMDGKRIAVLRTGRLGAGPHQVLLDPDRLRAIPRGRYLLDLRAGKGHGSAGFFLDR